MLNKISAFTIAALAAASAQAQSILPPKDKAAETAPPIVKAATPTPAKAAAPVVPAAKEPAKAAAAPPAATVVPPAPAVPTAPAPKVVVLSAAGSAAAQSGTITIAEIAAHQAKKLAAQTNLATAIPAPVAPAIAPQQYQQQIVPELLPGSAIPVVMNTDSKPAKAARKPTPPRSYLASIIGLKGQEIVEIQNGEGSGYMLKAGDSISNWSISRIADGKLFLVSSEYSKKTRKTTTKNKVLSVGDSL